MDPGEQKPSTPTLGSLKTIPRTVPLFVFVKKCGMTSAGKGEGRWLSTSLKRKAVWLSKIAQWWIGAWLQRGHVRRVWLSWPSRLWAWKCQLQKLSRWFLIPLLCSRQREKCWGFETESVTVGGGGGGGRGVTQAHFLQGRPRPTSWERPAAQPVGGSRGAVTPTALLCCRKVAKLASVDRRQTDPPWGPQGWLTVIGI